MPAKILLKPTKPKLIRNATPNQALDWPICWPAVLLLAQKEGLTFEAYVCPAGVPTNGWGETDGVYMGMPAWNKEYADQRLLDSVRERVAVVHRHVKVPLNENELGALVLLVYNIGEGNFAGDGKTKKPSTVLKRLNEGNRAAAAKAFGLFNQARNPATQKLEVVDGLTARRAQEEAMFLTPIPDDEGHVASPQEVAPESSLAKSPMSLSGAASVGTGALGLVSALGDQAETAGSAVTKVTTATTGVRGFLAQFDVTPPMFFGGLGIVIGGVVLYQRLKQRRLGWA